MLDFAAILVVGAAVLFMLLPMIQRLEAPLGRAADEPDELRSQRRVLLRGIRDADYDYATGKLDAADYLALKSELAKETFELMDEAGSVGEGVDQTSASDPSPRSSVDSSSCWSCHARIRGGTRFCTECGIELSR